MNFELSGASLWRAMSTVNEHFSIFPMEAPKKMPETNGYEAEG